MGPAERCDLVVDFSAFAGRSVVLDSAPQEPSSPLARLLPAGLRAGRAAHGVPRPPRALSRFTAPRPLPGQAARAAGVDAGRCRREPDRVFVFGQGVDTSGKRGLDDQRRAVRPRGRRGAAGARLHRDLAAGQPRRSRATTSTFTPSTGRSSRATAACPRRDEDVLKETFRLDPGETLAVGAKFTDHLGRFLIHCHMLSHEDHAMMTTFEIVAPGSGDRRRAADAPDAGQRDRARRARRRPARHADRRGGACARAKLLAAQAARARASRRRVPSEPLRLAAGVAVRAHLPAGPGMRPRSAALAVLSALAALAGRRAGRERRHRPDRRARLLGDVRLPPRLDRHRQAPVRRARAQATSSTSSSPRIPADISAATLEALRRPRLPQRDRQPPVLAAPEARRAGLAGDRQGHRLHPRVDRRQLLVVGLRRHHRRVLPLPPAHGRGDERRSRTGRTRSSRTCPSAWTSRTSTTASSSTRGRTCTCWRASIARRWATTERPTSTSSR